MGYQQVFQDLCIDTPFTALNSHDPTKWFDSLAGIRIGTSGLRLGGVSTCRSLYQGSPSATPKHYFEVAIFTFASAGKGPMVHFNNFASGFWDWTGYWMYVTTSSVSLYRGDNDGGGDAIATRSHSGTSGERFALRTDSVGNLSLWVEDVQLGADIVDASYNNISPALMYEATSDDSMDNPTLYNFVNVSRFLATRF